jgi:formylglycine-generating enzyme required for sulfatase activity
MQRRLLRYGLLALLLTAGLALPFLFAQPPQAKRYAVLVGVNRYEHPKLPALRFAETDVTDLAALLRDAGYQVTVLTGSAKDEGLMPTRATIEKKVHEVLRKCRAGDTAVLAFTGHGLQFDGKDDCFFCPLDARPFKDETDSLVSLSKVYGELDRSFAGMKVLLVDACRDDPDAARGARGVNADSAPRPPQGVAALFSCRAGERAFESEKVGHGVFFYHVLRGLKGEAKDRKGRVTFAGLAAYVQEEVAQGDEGVPKLIGGGARQSPNLKADYSTEPVLLTFGSVPREPDLGQVEGARPRSLDCTGADGVSAADVRRAQEAWAKYLGRQVEETVEIGDGVKMIFVLVPPGMFRMGSPSEEQDYLTKTFFEGKRPDWFGSERLHKVTLTEPFDLGKTEVTQAQYQALIGDNPSEFKGADEPVETVSWEEARNYAAKLTGKRSDKHTYRLPTEAEWEYSCRGGRSSSKPFGIGDGASLSSDQANFDGNYPYGGAGKGRYLEATCRVRSYPANPLGLFDMHGNVWEWCADWYGPYPQRGAPNPTGPAEGSSRVYRGGSWDDFARSCRAAFRDRGAPGYRNYDLGFRLARSAPSGGK